MDMITLKAEKRNLEMKAKKLRREGFVTGVLFGKERKETLPLQFDEAEILRFIKGKGEGTQVGIELEGEEIPAVVKNLDYDPMKKQVLAIDFQELVAGEKISTTVPIKLENPESILGVVEQELSEIHYKADPQNLLDPIEIDFSKLSTDVREMYVRDLRLTEKKAVQLITPEDALIFKIADSGKAEDAEEREEE